ncbi:MAG: putative signal transducing protein [Planctomycetota bacterium]
MRKKKFVWRNKMSKRSKKGNKSDAKLEGYVVVAFSEDMDQAREYKTLLESNDIPATIADQDGHAVGSKEIAVMVSEEFLDEAHVIIESQHAYDEFYDFSMEDEDEIDFESDYFDEDE